MTNKKYSSAILLFERVLDQNGLLTSPADMAPYLREWRDKYQGKAAGILRPSTTKEVVEIVKIAAQHTIKIVPQGGNTGLVGGQIAFDEEHFVLNLARLNRVRDVDLAGNTITVEAGMILQNIQNLADENDKLFPLSLGAEGSCQIGGNISSNAGGTSVLAYGNCRDLVLGLEVVLPNGEVLNGLNRLKKDNTGYDLKNLFIGAEGTLGVVTAAALKLFPKPRGQEVAILGFSSLKDVASFFNISQSLATTALTAFEIMPRLALDFLIKHFEGIKDPLEAPYDWYILAEISSGQSADHAQDLMMGLLEEGMEQGWIKDGVIAQSETHRKAFWHMRHELSACQKPEGGSIKHDVSVPIACLPAFIEEAVKVAQELIPECRPVPFGHWGDGNIHFNISQPISMDKQVFLNQWEEMNNIIHDVVLRYDGSISAEHGIGVMKREKLSKVKDPTALFLMREIKKTLDPEAIMNPGKVL